MSLKDKKILVGLTGGIACYKVPYLVRSLVKSGASVQVIMTESATKFITPLTLETVSGHPVTTDLFPENEFVATRHIDLAQWPDLIIVAPATANFLGKVSSGISDDMLTTVICAAPGPVMIAPAMNPYMWQNPITQRNVGTLREFGYYFIDPDEGEMACEDSGVGRMAEPDALHAAVESFFLTEETVVKKKKKKSLKSSKPLSGKNVIVTAGPCREPIDPVRYISNRSSGKMGFELARAAVKLGATTTLISGPTSLTPPCGVEFDQIETTQQLHKAVSDRFEGCDYLIMAAAPADFAAREVAGQKIKKREAQLKIDLEPTIDILKEMGARKKPGQILVGFALETENGVDNAQKKLREKNLDMIVLNNPREDGAGFDHSTNRVTIIRPGMSPEEWPLDSKAEISRRILDLTTELS